MSEEERRQSRRRPILDTFSFFVVVPKKGIHRLAIHDLSDTGIGFDIDTEGESADDYPVKQGESIELHFYLNQSLYLPLSATVARVMNEGGIRKIGAQFSDKGSNGFKALSSFLGALDEMMNALKITSM